MPRPVTQASWRPAPLPAVPCRQLATLPIRILALSPAQAFRAACRVGQRLPALPTGRASSLSGRPHSLSEQADRSTTEVSRNARSRCAPRNPNNLLRPVSRTISSVSSRGGAPPVAKPTDSAITPTAGRHTYQCAARPTASAEGSSHCQRALFSRCIGAR